MLVNLQIIIILNSVFSLLNVQNKEKRPSDFSFSATCRSQLVQIIHQTGHFSFKMVSENLQRTQTGFIDAGLQWSSQPAGGAAAGLQLRDHYYYCLCYLMFNKEINAAMHLCDGPTQRFIHGSLF